MAVTFAEAREIVREDARSAPTGPGLVFSVSEAGRDLGDYWAVTSGWLDSDGNPAASGIMTPVVAKATGKLERRSIFDPIFDNAVPVTV